ncbi:MAG: NTP transferase domain-containing protein [Desulfobacteraceae bacterium]
MDRKGEQVAGIILAAGRSKRMGSAKQLLPFSDGILLGRVMEAALKARLSRVVLVLGYQAEAIKAALKERTDACPRVTVTVNPHFDRGMSSSIIAGLSVVEETHDHVMILLADMPFIGTQVINLLLERYLASDMPIGAIQVPEGTGHPVVFSRALYPELRQLEGDTGARRIVEKYSQRICLVRPTVPYNNTDIDTAADYAKACGILDKG